MKPGKAISKLNGLKFLSTRAGNVIGNFAGIEIDLAIEALEKQLPKKYKKDIYKNQICPICESILQGVKRHCDWCGQKLDWEGLV